MVKTENLNFQMSNYIPFVAELRQRYSIDVKVPSYFTLDGEDTQIKRMQSWDIRQAY
jgi:hypothetical protein